MVDMQPVTISGARAGTAGSLSCQIITLDQVTLPHAPTCPTALFIFLASDHPNGLFFSQARIPCPTTLTISFSLSLFSFFYSFFFFGVYQAGVLKTWTVLELPSSPASGSLHDLGKKMMKKKKNKEKGESS